MSEVRHTPGPWHIDPPTVSGALPIREGPSGFLIATVWPDDARKEAADAHLISAAPCLLAALTGYLSAQRRMLEKWADGDSAVKAELWSAVHECEDEAIAAIAKATTTQGA